ncbi:MAG TPA: DUF5693 family protein [Patescibacteria group bacterium]|nr:DUF5693 family protein [Patescibacteria group bacterium]
MARCYTYNRLLIALIVLGLLAALTIDWQRHRVEDKNSRVELVMDYDDVVELSQIDGVPLPELMTRFREAGVNSLAVSDTNLEKLTRTGQVAVLSGTTLLQEQKAGGVSQSVGLAAGTFRPEALYLAVTGSDPALFEELKEDLARRLGADRVAEVSVGGQPMLEVRTNHEKIMKWNLGLSTAEMRLAAAQGLMVVARPANYAKVTAADVEALFDRLDKAQLGERLTSFMFVGEEALGYPGQLPLVAQKMQQRGMSLAMIEHPVQLQFVRQDGLLPLAVDNGYRSVRAYTIPKDELPKITVAESVRRIGVTDPERNIRMNLLRRCEKIEPGKTMTETNLFYVQEAKKELLRKGFSFGRADTFEPYFPSPLLLAAVIAGATASGVLFLALILPLAVRWQYGLWAVLSILLTVPVLKGGGLLVRQMVALECAVIFPVLAMTWSLDYWQRRMDQQPAASPGLGKVLVGGLTALVVVSAISLAGGLYLGAVLADVRFFLEMEIFRGVKVTFVAPLLLMVVVYLTRYHLFAEVEAAGARGFSRQVKRLLDFPVTIRTLLMFGAAAAVALVYIGRSGHTAGVPVPDIEIKLRNFLDQAMYARPREKEFLIGHPAYLLAVMAVARQWPRIGHFALIMLATVGQSSMVETFAHLRSPVLMSVMRGLDGLMVGAVLGILAVVAVQVLLQLAAAWERRMAADE